MATKDDNTHDATKGGIIEGLEGLTTAAQAAAKQAENAAETPFQHVSDLADSARQTADAAKNQAETPFQHVTDLADAARETAAASEAAKKQHDHAASVIAQAQAADAQHHRQQTQADQLRHMAESALATAEAARKEKERKDAEQATLDAEEEPFHGSGGVGSAEQLDAIRQGYANAGIADPSGMTANSDQTASSQDDTTNQN